MGGTPTYFPETAWKSVVNPGFPRGRQLPRGVCQPIILLNFCQKLHENKKAFQQDAYHLLLFHWGVCPSGCRSPRCRTPCRQIPWIQIPPPPRMRTSPLDADHPWLQSPPVDRRNDTCLWKHYVPATTDAGGNERICTEGGYASLAPLLGSTTENEELYL